MKTGEEIDQLAESALKNEEGGNINLWPNGDYNEEREYWKEVWKKGHHAAHTKFSNKLTPAELERLALLAEECAEVQQIAMKIIRHGYESYNPFDPEKTSNRELLNKEIGDLNFVLELMVKRKDISLTSVQTATDKKQANIQKYLHHNNL